MTKKKGTVHEVSAAELDAKLHDAGSERREQPRVEARLEIDVPLATWEQARRVYTTNISQGGLLFELEGPTTMPAEIALTLTLPDGQQVSLKAEVRHVEAPSAGGEGKKFDVGVQFTQLDEETARLFNGALASIQK